MKTLLLPKILAKEKRGGHVKNPHAVVLRTYPPQPPPPPCHCSFQATVFPSEQHVAGPPKTEPACPKESFALHTPFFTCRPIWSHAPPPCPNSLDCLPIMGPLPPFTICLDR